jgi:hypothetical protein
MPDLLTRLRATGEHMILPRNTVSLRVDYGKPDWRAPAPGEPHGARAGGAGMTPGSPEAIKAGCTCPVLDNAHGKGYMGGAKDRETGKTLFVYNCACPVHKEQRT